MDSRDHTTGHDGKAATDGAAAGAAGTLNRQPSPRMLRKRARTREHMLDVAERLYAESGQDDVRMEDLADAANVSIGLIYDHFGSKDGVFLALAERSLDDDPVHLSKSTTSSMGFASL